MEMEKAKGVIEAILFATGRIVKAKELMSALELSFEELSKVITEMQTEYKNANRGIEIIRIEDGFSLASKKEYHDFLYPLLDKRIKPKLSQASLEVLAIIAYNQRVTKADIDSIRGVDSGGPMYRLQEYNLIEPAGKADLPGKPMTYKTTDNFMKMFGLKSLKELPELPKYKFDSNRQIVIEDIEAVEDKENLEAVEDKEDIEAVEDIEDIEDIEAVEDKEDLEAVEDKEDIEES